MRRFPHVGFALCGVAFLGLCVGSSGCRDDEPTEVITNSIGMKLVYIKPGTFLMGSALGEEGYDIDEGPQHHVTISRGFYMGACEVTQEQYEKVMGDNPSHFKKGGNYPVETVSWYSAVEFCKKLSAREGKTYRLPTEAEWEYACRAGSTTRFCSGDSDSGLGEYAWHSGNSFDKTLPVCRTRPVGEKRPNAWGLHDMHGNVGEWCQDWYVSDYYGRSPDRDPQGPSEVGARLSVSGKPGVVIRGGSFASVTTRCRSAARYKDYRDFRDKFTGLRVVSPESTDASDPRSLRTPRQHLVDGHACGEGGLVLISD